MGHPPMPLICLTKRILLISANSASCERLFSIFGNTLTKIRNQLGTNTLTNLAELKMFLHDQHLKRGTKKCLKNISKGCVEDANYRHSSSQQPDADMNIDPSLPVSSSSASSQIPANQSTQNPTDSQSNHASAHPMLSSQDDSLSSESDNDEPLTADLESTTACNQRLAGTSFRTIVNTHSRLTSEDEVNTRPVTAPLTIKNCIPIQQLFDFHQSHWVDKYQKHPLRSFDEELALYELLDLDAQGEDNIDVDVNDTTGDILHS